ncbi:MAG: glycosyltransferase family 4 protein [Promethearchaeota archaeon]
MAKESVLFKNAYTQSTMTFTNEFEKPIIAIVAHKVTVPIKRHRRIEFMKRCIYFSKYFSNFFLISIDPKVHQCNIQYDPSINTYVYRIPRRLLISSVYIKRIVDERNIDILFADTFNDSYRIPYSKLLKKQLISILFLQGFQSHLDAMYLRAFLGLEVKRSWIEKFFKARDSLIINTFDATFCVSKALSKYVKSLLSSKKQNMVYYIPHSLEYIKYIPNESLKYAKKVINNIKQNEYLRKFNDDINVLCYVGGLFKNKRPDIPIVTLSYIIKKIPNTILLVIGDGPLKMQLRSLAKKLKVEKNVFFLGHQPQYHAISFMSMSDLMIFPSLSEGFSMAVAEALAVGCPVLSYANEPTTELARNGGIIIVDEPNPIKFSDKAIEILSNFRFRRELIEQGKLAIMPFVNFKEENRFKLMINYILDVYAKTKHES